LDTKTTEKVAHLAKLALTDDELMKVSEKLTLVLSHFEKIEEVNTSGVEPLVTPIDVAQVLRSDDVEQTITAEDIVSNAPARQGNLFKVPPIL
jgi:aspartyl-tRNA(Asn)/glutamyl-tRNA(Gln) amidotransferase subunit C